MFHSCLVIGSKTGDGLTAATSGEVKQERFGNGNGGDLAPSCYAASTAGNHE
jgi:hypothetical protein